MATDVRARIAAEIDHHDEQADEMQRADQVVLARGHRAGAAYLRTFLDDGDADELAKRRRWIEVLRTVLGEAHSDRLGRDAMLNIIPDDRLAEYVAIYREIVGV